MNKKLQEYIKEIDNASSKPTPELIKYHEAMLAQFQHERLIHLIVTMFFALFTIIFFGITCFLATSVKQAGWGAVMTACAGIVCLILLIVMIFYIHHYYQLENGVQRLEEITKKLYKK